jgi:general secretion pathway protein G
MRIYKKKRTLTLLEMMIVIVLIGLIGSVIGFNMKGSLDEGRAFKTRKAREQIQDILMLEVARGVPAAEVVQDKQKYLANSGLVKNPAALLKDGWNQDFEVKVDGRSNERIIVSSAKLTAYEQNKSAKLGRTVVETVEDED